MDYYIQPQQYQAPNLSSRIQGWAGLAEMADRAEQAPVNLATAKANLAGIEAQNAQRKLTDPVQLATSQKNLDILNQSYKHNEILHPLQIQEYKNSVQTGLLNIENLQRQAEAQKKAQQSLDDAILENQTNPNGENAVKLNIAAAARNPQAYAIMQSAMTNADDRTRKIAFDTSFDTWTALASGSPDDARTVLQTSIDAATNSGRKDLAAKFQSDLKMLDTDPTGNSLLTKSAMVAANSPQHKAAMDMYGKSITLPASVQRDVKKEQDAVESANALESQLSDLQDQWEKMPSHLNPIQYVGAKAAESLPFLRGKQDDLRLLTDSYLNLDRLKEFKKAMGSMGIRNLKEFETALGGKVSVYSDKEQVIDRIKVIRSLLSKEASLKEANANWLSTFRGSTIATKPGMITGIPIEKGSNVKDFQKQYAQKMFEEAQLDVGNVDAQGNPRPMQNNMPNAPTGAQTRTFSSVPPAPANSGTVNVIMPDGMPGHIRQDQVEEFKKKYPGAKFQ